MQWINQRINDLRQHTDRPISIRPHPRCPLSQKFSHRNVSIEIPRKVAHTYDDFDLDLRRHAVININSGPGLLAPMMSTPVIVDESSLAYPISISIQDVESPPPQDIDQWLIKLAHTEYVLEEIDQGLWLKRLCSRL